MARESKRKRDGRRFGRPRRLLDVAADESIIGYPAWWPQDKESLTVAVPHLRLLWRRFLDDAAGRILAEPKGIIDGVDERALAVVKDSGQFLQALMLTLSFMNCKNVTLDPVEPDARLNRERRLAGMKPFVRYHTINIEPMKRVLRDEGGIEQHGLKKALHIVRGHFAHHTDRMFGRELETPVTVWRPAHVRGSAKEGIVVSDYRVDVPKGVSAP